VRPRQELPALGKRRQPPSKLTCCRKVMMLAEPPRCSLAMQLAAKQPSRQEIVLRRVIIEPIWEMGMDGSAKLVSRRNVHTDEVEIVEGWGNESQ
jgi:hypothetical protein